MAYAAAIKAADPNAVIAGPSPWGWTAYELSALDVARGYQLRPDRRNHGDKPLLAWYLERMRRESDRRGVRLLDVLDVHFYPAGDGLFAGSTDPDAAARRIRSVRGLWDPDYKDESWIDDEVQLVPRLRRWIDDNYPGTGISIGEWNFGAATHMSGGLATAEALGRFGTTGCAQRVLLDRPAGGQPRRVGLPGVPQRGRHRPALP